MKLTQTRHSLYTVIDFVPLTQREWHPIINQKYNLDMIVPRVSEEQVWTKYPQINNHDMTTPRVSDIRAWMAISLPPDARKCVYSLRIAPYLVTFALVAAPHPWVLAFPGWLPRKQS